MTALAHPHPQPWTVDRGPWTDLYALPDNGVRYELLDGILLVSPAPVLGHQLATGRLRQLLARAAPPQLEVVEAVNVRLPTGLLVPDVVVADAAPFHQGARDLQPHQVRAVIEVSWPWSRRADRHWKHEAYAEAGIPSYWRVELVAPGGPRIVVGELAAGS